MARKRLSGPKPEFLPGADASAQGIGPGGLETKPMFGVESVRTMPPVAQVAAESAAEGALRDLIDDMDRARSEGRMVIEVPCDEIAPDHLARDRIGGDVEEMRALTKSIHKHGQRTPIEITALPEGGRYKYGLISGWRRLTALEQLQSQTGDAKYNFVLALLRSPKDSADAYVSMVEENEIRVGLSYYERARAAAEATKRGVFDSEKQALQTLFASASRAKRSRIRSFIDLYHALDGDLAHPAAIPERLGLATVEALRGDPEVAARIRAGLKAVDRQSAEQEMTALAVLIAPSKPARASNVPRAEHLTEVLESGLKLVLKGNKIEITGASVSAELLKRLVAALGGR